MELARFGCTLMKHLLFGVIQQINELFTHTQERMRHFSWAFVSSVSWLENVPWNHCFLRLLYLGDDVMSAKMGTTRNKGKGVVLFIFANLLPGKRNKCLTIFLFSFVSVCVSLPNWVRRCGNGRFACGRIPIRRMGTNDLHLYLKRQEILFRVSWSEERGAGLAVWGNQKN